MKKDLSLAINASKMVRISYFWPTSFYKYKKMSEIERENDFSEIVNNI